MTAMTASEQVWAEALARPSFVAAIDAGLADLAAGRTHRWEDVKARLEAQMTEPREPDTAPDVENDPVPETTTTTTTVTETPSEDDGTTVDPGTED